MDAAVAGLIGAAIGAIAGMTGTLITAYFQAKQEHRKWMRDKRVEAYSNTIRYLVRALNKRSILTFEGGTLTSVIGKDVIKEWFDDLSEVLVWLSAVSMYCSRSQQSEIARVTKTVNESVCSFVNSNSLEKFDLPHVISSALETVERCARQDVGRAVK
jgi:gas vesicle protein